VPVEIIGMIGMKPEGADGTAVHVIGGAVDTQWARALALVHEKAGFDRVLVGYTSTSAEGFDLPGPGSTIAQFKVFAIKSRVHFRRGFDDSGFAKTILLVEPEQPFLGTVRLEALPYRNVDISTFYPYGDVTFPWSRPC
jgi:hypothetical protein